MLLGQNIRRTDGEVRDMKRHSLGSSSQFNTDLFYYPLEKLETNSHNHILQSLTMDTFLDIHKLTVPYSGDQE
jgi:hypothetical protein